MEKSLKNQAEEIMVAVNRDLQAVEAKPPAVQQEVDAKTNLIMKKLFGVINDVDVVAAEKRVRDLRQTYPDASPEEISQKLIAEKCRRTGLVGAATSGAALIPGIGTAAAMTLGVATDIGATFKLQSELVLEIAAAYDYPLTEAEKQRIVLLITGISAGGAALTRRAGQTVAVKVSERVAEKTFLKALPVIGIVASAGTNVLSTYIIGQRADAYFRLGPEAMGSWTDSIRAISGVDERKIGAWLTENGKSVGETVTVGAGRVVEAVGAGAQVTKTAAQSGLKTYLHWFRAFWSAIFRGVGAVLGWVWAALTFIPRRIGGLFRR